MTVGSLLHLVFKAGDTEVQQIQQAVDLQHRQVRHPALQECCICILQHPQETHQQGSAALGRQRAGLAPGLVKTNTQNSVAVPTSIGREKHNNNRLFRGQRSPYRQTTGSIDSEEGSNVERMHMPIE